MKRLCLTMLAAGLLGSTSGCWAVHEILHSPLNPRSVCRPGHTSEGWCGAEGCGIAEGCSTCGVDCGVGCGMVGGPIGCDTGCVEPCGQCGVAPCCCAGEGLIGGILHLFHPITFWGPACGEKYCGDWYSDPPSCCDPCDTCGNYVGCGCVGGGCASGGCASGDCYAGAAAPALGSDVQATTANAIVASKALKSKATQPVGASYGQPGQLPMDDGPSPLQIGADAGPTDDFRMPTQAELAREEEGPIVAVTKPVVVDDRPVRR